MLNLNRRNLVKLGASALGMGVPNQSWAWTKPGPADTEPHFMVFAQVYGAWDVCLAFDPKDRDSRLSNGQIAFDQPYDYSEVTQHGPIMLAPHGQAIAPFSDR